MAQNIVVGLFEVESEAYQALTELRQYPGDNNSYLSAAALAKKQNGSLTVLDGFDTGSDTMDDMAVGGLIGTLVGILGGPIGMLLGGSTGLLIGSIMDTDDAVMNNSMLEQIASVMQDGEIAIVGLAYEENEEILNAKLNKFKTTVIRFDAATVAAEVEEAERLQDEMARQAREDLRDEKKAERKAKREEKKAKLSEDWENFKAKFQKKDKEDKAEA